VAAELLVPIAAFEAEVQKHVDLRVELPRLAKCFKVSTLVILRRLSDLGALGRERFKKEYDAELERLLAMPKGKGGNFYLTQAARLSKRFARAILVSTLEGRSSFTEAFRLLGVKKMATFRDLGHTLGVGA
jgi:Zn-dependent peptidase ImmA (M78 family)